jgi:hypothetical protein
MLYVPIETRRSHKPIEATRSRFKRLGSSIFTCSAQRRFGGAKGDSDVDLFSIYEKLGLFELMDVKAYAASILGVRPTS